MIRRRCAAEALRALVVAVCLAGCWGCQRGAEPPGGFTTRYHVDATGQRVRYVVFVPYMAEPGESLPVILFLNGHGESGDDGLLQISNNFGVDLWRKQFDFPFLAVCPQCSRSGDWHPSGPDGQRAMAILDEAMQEFHGDPDRVYLTGVSRGGTGVWSLAAAYPDTFAALVPISAIGSEGAAEVAKKANLPYWSFHNGRDRSDVVQSARSAHELFIQAGLSPLTTEYDDEGHNAWHSYNNPHLYAWLLRQSRSANATRPKFHPWSPEEVLESWRSDGAGQSKLGAKGEITVTASGDEVCRLICPESFQDGEVHLDAFLTDEGSSPLALVAADGVRVGALDIRLATAGIGGIRWENADNVAFDPIAQRALRSGWNDIRIVRREGVITILLNGWQAIETLDPHAGEPIGWGLVARPGEASRWRYMRTLAQVGAGGG